VNSKYGSLRAVGAFSSRQVPLGWGYEKSSGKARFCSLVSLNLSWGMAPRSIFGMICDVETQPSK